MACRNLQEIVKTTGNFFVKRPNLATPVALLPKEGQLLVRALFGLAAAGCLRLDWRQPVRAFELEKCKGFQKQTLLRFHPSCL